MDTISFLIRFPFVLVLTISTLVTIPLTLVFLIVSGIQHLRKRTVESKLSLHRYFKYFSISICVFLVTLGLIFILGFIEGMTPNFGLGITAPFGPNY